MRKAFRLVVRPLSALSLASGVLAMLGVLSILVVAPRALAGGDVNMPECPAETQASPGFRTSLPDCRAYEMVTPPFKFGLLPQGRNGDEEFLDEGHLKTASIGGFSGAGTDEGIEGSNYVITRASSGWSTTAVDLPESQFGEFLGTHNTSRVLDVNQNFSKTLELSRPQGAQPVDGRFYIRRAKDSEESCPPGSVQSAETCAVEVGPTVPQAAVESWPERHFQEPPPRNIHPLITYRGASHDLTHVLFESEPPRPGEPNWLWPGDTSVHDGNGSLYEYSGTGNSVPTLVGVDNTNRLINQCGTSVGSYRSSHTDNAISAAGSTVFFTTASTPKISCSGTEPNVGQLFARIGEPGSSRVTVNLAGISSCAASASCDVTSEPVFQGASSDGSKVFFTTTQALSTSDLDTTPDIYECELPGDSGSPPTPVADVNPCPSLRPISVTGAVAGARVQSVVAISEDGSHVYFTAEGVVASNENGNGEKATLNDDNLYVYERDARFPLGHLAFIGKPSSSGPRAEDTPDGRFLLFASRNHLTPDAQGGSEQLYRYDAEAQSGEPELVRVSVGEGILDNQEASAFIFPGPKGRVEHVWAGPEGVSMSDDGQYVFFNSETGLTDGALNKEVIGCEEEFEGECFEVRYANNVYEYHGGHVYLISDGQDRHLQLGALNVELIGASHSGHDVYFRTADVLVPQDGDTQVDIYDARVDGGFPAPTALVSCQVECQGSLSVAPSLLSPGSSVFSGPGNPLPSAPKPAVKPKPKAKVLTTRAQKLSKALRECRRKPRKQRAVCVRRAEKAYGARPRKAKHSHHTHRRGK